MKINFLVDNLGASQLSYYLIKTCNQLVSDGQYQTIIFYDKMSRRNILPLFATMHLVEAWGQKGITIATSLSTATRLLNFPGPESKLFYIWDFEWIRGPLFQWDLLSDIFHHPELTLIAPSDTHAKAIFNTFNRMPEYIVDNCNAQQFKEVFINESVRK